MSKMSRRSFVSTAAVVSVGAVIPEAIAVVPDDHRQRSEKVPRQPEILPDAPRADHLSFVVRNTPDRPGGGFNYWNVQPTGRYSEDCERGRELAAEYLAFMARYPIVGNVTLLPLIVGSMMDAAIARGIDTTKPWKRLGGVEGGFLRHINEYAMTTAVLVKDVERSAVLREFSETV